MFYLPFQGTHLQHCEQAVNVYNTESTLIKHPCQAQCCCNVRLKVKALYILYSIAHSNSAHSQASGNDVLLLLSTHSNSPQ